MRFHSFSPRLAASLVAGAILLAACADDSGVDLVLRGGIVATVDADDSMAEALAIDDGWIVAVGGNEDVDALIGAGTEVIELDGRLAAPGFIEGHGHYMSLGNSKTILDLNGAANWDAIVAMVAEAVQEAEPGQWIRGRGWHQEKWDTPPDPAVEGNPTHASLSAVSPDNPVLLGHASGHAAFANAPRWPRLATTATPNRLRAESWSATKTASSPDCSARQPSAPSPPPSRSPSRAAPRKRSRRSSGMKLRWRRKKRCRRV